MSNSSQYPADTYPTTMVTLDYVSKEIVKIVLKTQDGRKINFSAGQYAQIEIPESGKKQPYAFSGISGKNTVEFLIRIVSDGVMSSYLRSKAKVGDSITITAPLGDFYLRNPNKPILFFAGGTGVSPILAMLELLNTVGGTQPIKLFYGAVTDDHLVELNRLDGFKNKLPFQYWTCTVEKSDKHPQGFVNQWITKDILGDIGYDIYICGPSPMVVSIKNALIEAGVDVSNVFVPY